MAEFLVMVDYREGHDPVRNAGDYEPGDVVVIKPDGWPWSQAEINNPRWRLCKAPGVTVAQLEDLTRALFQQPTPTGETKCLYKRTRKFDLAAARLAGTAPGTIITISNAQQRTRLLAAKIAKATETVSIG